MKLKKTLCLYYPFGAGVWGIWLSANATLQFDVELLSWSSVKDICKDGGVLKKIREKRETPKDLDEVLVKYEDGTVVGKSDGAEFHWYFCPALAKAVKTMKKAEMASQPLVVKVAVPPNATLEITLELVSWKIVSEVTDDNKVIKKILKEGEVYERPNEGAVVKGLHFEFRCINQFLVSFICSFLAVKLIGKLQDGTVFLKKGHGEGEEPFEFKTDEEQVIDGLDRAVMKMKKQAKALKVACNLNDAACKLKLQDYKQAEMLCTKVLELESTNVKALYKRAQAYMELADFDLAEFDVKKALEIDPNNREVKVEQRRLKEKMKEFNKKEAKFYGNMFAKVNVNISSFR
ncbi:unnamed protein product [Brassica rapa subsp. narinosa]